MSKKTISSETRWAGKGVGVEVTVRQHRWVIGAAPEEGPSPIEVLLSSLGACLSVLADMVAPQHGVELTSFAVTVKGDFDADGYKEKAPVRIGFQEIRYEFHVESSSPKERVAALLEHIQRVCPVCDTLNGVPMIHAPSPATGAHDGQEAKALPAGEG